MEALCGHLCYIAYIRRKINVVNPLIICEV